MTDLFLIPILTLLAAMASLIAARDVIFVKNEEVKSREVFKKNVSKKKLSMSGLALIFCALATVGLSYWQQIQNKQDINKTNRQARIDLDMRDSLNNLRIEKSKNETIEALARYGLEYDSTSNQIINYIKDSSGVKYKASVGVCLDGSGFEVNGNSPVSFDMRVCNYGQEHAYNFKMGVGYILIRGGKPEVNILYKFPSGVRISAEKSFFIPNLSISNSDPIPQNDTLYVFLKGNYSSAETTVKESVLEFFRYEEQTNSFSFQDSQHLLKFIRNINFK